MNEDIKLIADQLELEVVEYFQSTDMAGTVNFAQREQICYFSIDLADQENVDIDKLHHFLGGNLFQWAQENANKFKDPISVSRLTFHYVLPEIENTIMDKYKRIKLFYLPSYFKSHNSVEKPLGPVRRRILQMWNNVILRNGIFVLIPVLCLVVWGGCQISCGVGFANRGKDIFEYVNTSSGIMASFVLSFLVNKITIIRQEKLKHSNTIKNLSNKLSYFRNICYGLAHDHANWNISSFKKSYEYAISISNDITYLQYHYPDYNDPIAYAKYRSFYSEEVNGHVVLLILQLKMMANDADRTSGLTYTEFPPDYIYSSEEMNEFAIFIEDNQIWYANSEASVLPNFFPSYWVTAIIADYNRIFPKSKITTLDGDALQKVSLEFQYKVIPRLHRLTELVNAALPLPIRYFLVISILLLVFGIVVPTIIYTLFEKPYFSLSVFIVVGVLSHVILSLKYILQSENLLNVERDYL